MSIQDLKNKYTWPSFTPEVSKRYKPSGVPDGWCAKPNIEMFKRLINKDTKVIVDAGSWLGLSAWHFLKLAPNATVICLDTWLGSEEHKDRKIIPILYETFIKNMWEYKDRIIPVREDSRIGFAEIAISDTQPDLIYIDMAHDRDSVIRDICNAIRFFPRSKICGDDFTWQGVKEALDFLTKERSMNFKTYETCWELIN